MLLRSSLLNQVRAFPTNVELNMWHHTGCGQFSIVAADSKIFRWSSGSPVPSYVLTLAGMRLLLSSEKSLMRRVNASTFWRRQGRDISSSSSLRCLLLDFKCHVSLSSLSEESLEDELTLLRRLRRLSSESKLEGLSLGECCRPSLS